MMISLDQDQIPQSTAVVEMSMKISLDQDQIPRSTSIVENII